MHAITITGCTVHLVDEVVDAGAIIVQPRCSVAADDTAETLKSKVTPPPPPPPPPLPQRSRSGVEQWW